MASVSWARALYDYEPQDEDECELHKGEVIEILDSGDTDWWRARVDGRAGDVPAAYCELIDDYDEPAEEVPDDEDEDADDLSRFASPEEGADFEPAEELDDGKPHKNAFDEPEEGDMVDTALEPADDDDDDDEEEDAPPPPRPAKEAPKVKSTSFRADIHAPAAPAAARRAADVPAALEPTPPSSSHSSSQGRKRPVAKSLRAAAPVSPPEVAPEAAPRPKDLKAMRVALARAEAEERVLADKAEALRRRRVDVEAAEDDDDEEEDSYVETAAAQRLAEAARQQSDRELEKRAEQDRDAAHLREARDREAALARELHEAEEQRRAFADDIAQLQLKRERIAEAARAAEADRAAADDRRAAAEQAAEAAAKRLQESEARLRADAAAAAAPGPDAAMAEVISRIVNERLTQELATRDSAIDGVRAAMERLQHELVSQASRWQQALQDRGPEQPEKPQRQRGRQQRQQQLAPRSSRSEASVVASKRAADGGAALGLKLPSLGRHGSVGGGPQSTGRRVSPRSAEARPKVPKATAWKHRPKAAAAAGDADTAAGEPAAPEFDENLPRVASLNSNKAKKAQAAVSQQAVRVLAAQAAVRYRGCKSTVFAPDGAPAAAAAAPESGLELEHAHGYAGEPARKGHAGGRNALWTTDGCALVFPAAALVVLHDPAKNRQTFFHGHATNGDAVTALARHPNEDVFASGQAGKRPKICVWRAPRDDAADADALAELQLPGAARAVALLRFSPCGHLLLSLASDEAQTMTVWDWRRAQALVQQRCGAAHLHSLEFHASLYSVAADASPDWSVVALQPGEAQYCLASCGARHVKFWTLTLVDDDDAPASKARAGCWKVEGTAAAFSKHHSELNDASFTALASVVDVSAADAHAHNRRPAGRYVLGTDRGALTVWDQADEQEFSQDNGDESPRAPRCRWLPRGRCVAVFAGAHEGSPVHDICVAGLNPEHRSHQHLGLSRVASCGKDGRLKVWLLAPPLPVAAQSTKVAAGAGLFECVVDVAVAAQAPLLGPARSLCWDDAEKRLVVGTQGNALALVDTPYLSSAALPAELEPPPATPPHGADAAEGTSPKSMRAAMHAALRAAAAAAETAHANVGVQIFHHAHAGRINAVAAHPTAAVAASVGVDRTLRLWDCAERRLSQLVRLPDRATALAFHPDGRTLALGCDKGELVLLTCEGASPARGWTVSQRRRVPAKAKGGGRRPSEVGAANRVVATGAIDGDDFLPDAADGKASGERAAVADLKYSADGKVLAVACADKCIYIFAADAGYKRKCVLKGHSVAPTRLDFDVSGRMLQSNDLAREVLFWDVQSGKQLTNAFALRNTQWATWTCPLGWPVQAVSDGGEGDGAAPEALAAVVARSGDSGALVSPGAANQLRLLSYPALRGALAKHYACHRDAVSGLAFTAGDERVVSAGGKDATLAMWRHT